MADPEWRGAEIRLRSGGGWLPAGLGLGLVLLALAGAQPSPPADEVLSLRVAVIGDYGAARRSTAEATAEAAVATQVAGWSPDYVVSTGDNNYPSGSAATIDDNIGRFYHSFIAPYTGTYGLGAPGGVNRFFPALGNHDYLSSSAQPYVNYFALPGNERYYAFQWGPIHWFILDSDPVVRGVEISTTQALWLQQGLAASSAPWQVVVMHHPPYSSGLHGSTPVMQWPYAAWGADAVLAGHDHNYERLLYDGGVYFVNGSGGATLYPLGPPVTEPLPGSQVRYWAAHGALLIAASDTVLRFEFITTAGEVIDTYQLEQAPVIRTVWLPLLYR